MCNGLIAFSPVTSSVNKISPTISRRRWIDEPITLRQGLSTFAAIFSTKKGWIERRSAVSCHEVRQKSRDPPAEENSPRQRAQNTMRTQNIKPLSRQNRQAGCCARQI